MVRVESVQDGSIASALEIPAGTLLLRINGRDLRDSLDLLYYESDERILVEALRPGGEVVEFDIEKDAGERLGIVPEPDKVRRCTNACPFCFVKGNPKKNRLRAPLYVKDDDYRLSFLFGHYVTLTNLRDDDWDRIIEQRLSPLYVSVHVTDPEVRLRMLRNPRSAQIRAHLDRLAAGGIRIHAQVVLCPGLNDGPVLSRTIDELYARATDVLSLSVVPVGLTEHNLDRGVRLLERDEARDAIERIEMARERALRERGLGWCYAADELFLQAGRELPDSAYFDDHDLVANGVGAVTALREKIRTDLPRLPRLDGLRIVLVTGTSMGPHLKESASEIGAASGGMFETIPVANTLYGPRVTTAGLLCGADHLETLRPLRDRDLAIISRTALNERDMFLDDMSLEELQRALPGFRICPSEHVTDVLIRG